MTLRDLVLVADSDVERAERLATACRARGVDVEVASHGARALEIALAELPVALVTQIDLPLIEGARLAEILRANPRTEDMGILFIADGRAVPPDRGAGRVLPGSADPETIVAFVEALLLKHRPQREESGEALGGIEGELSQLPLTELIELFHVNRKTGRILVQRGPSRRREHGQVVLREGDVVHAATGRVEGEKALYRLFAWGRGRFEFVPDPTPSEISIDRSTRTLLRDGRRQVAEWERLVADLPPQHSRAALVVSREELPSVLHPLTQEVLMVLEHTDRVDALLDRCSFPDYQVLRTLTTLVRRGLVELRREGRASAGRGAATAISPGLAARLRERLERSRSGPDAKVLVIASDEAASATLAAKIGALPGGVPAPPAAHGAAVRSLAQLDLDEDLSLHWILAPADARFSPIWPTAAYGSLTVVFAHSGPLEASVATLRPAIDEIASLPRVRTLHALVTEKPGDPSPAALCEALSLFDERRVVEIPQGDAAGGDTGTRELLQRVLA